MSFSLQGWRLVDGAVGRLRQRVQHTQHPRGQNRPWVSPHPRPCLRGFLLSPPTSPVLSEQSWHQRPIRPGPHVLLFQCSCLLFNSAFPLAHTYSNSSGPHSRTLHKIRPLGQRNTQGTGHEYCRSRGLREMEVQLWDTFIKFPPFSKHSASQWGAEFNNMH